MNILVWCQVARICGQGGISAGTGRIDPGSLVHMLNPCDEVAVEEALRIREKMGEGSVGRRYGGLRSRRRRVAVVPRNGGLQRLPYGDRTCRRHGHVGNCNRPCPFLTTMEYDLILFGKQTLDYVSARLGRLFENCWACRS